MRYRGEGLENSIYNPKALKTALTVTTISEELRAIKTRGIGGEKSSEKEKSTIEWIRKNAASVIILGKEKEAAFFF